MATTYLKKAEKSPATGEDETREIVSKMLAEIEAGGEEAARAYGEKLDNFTGNIVVTPEEIDAASANGPAQRMTRSRKFQNRPRAASPASCGRTSRRSEPSFNSGKRSRSQIQTSRQAGAKRPINQVQCAKLIRRSAPGHR